MQLSKVTYLASHILKLGFKCKHNRPHSQESILHSLLVPVSPFDLRLCSLTQIRQKAIHSHSRGLFKHKK